MKYKYKQKVKVKSQFYGDFEGILVDYKIFSSEFTSKCFYTYLVNFTIGNEVISEWFDESQVIEILENPSELEWINLDMLNNFKEMNF